MACYSCSENKSENTISILQMYKTKFENSGDIFWFYTVKGSNEVNIMDNESFKAFKKSNKKLFDKKQIEFAHISEFRISESNSILEDSKN